MSLLRLTSVLVLLLACLLAYLHQGRRLFPAMSCNSALSIRLTSTAVPVATDGNYTYDQVSFLFPHEPIRREMERCLKALEKADVAQFPWKAKYLQVWLTEFFVPIIKDHHDAEEQCFDPSYEKLGVSLPVTLKQGHDKLSVLLQKLTTDATELGQHSDTEHLAAVRATYQELYDLMIAHLAEEEAFWPAVIREHGEETYRNIHAEMHKMNKQQPSGKMFLMSVFDSMGYEFDATNPTHDASEDTRWCSEKMLDDIIMNKIPYFVRAWIFPAMNTKYQHYKQMINTVAKGQQDNVPLNYEENSTCTTC